MVIVYAIIGMVGILAFGYWELKAKENKNYGLTTWVFGAAPFIGILVWVGNQEALPLAARVVLIVLLMGSAWKGLTVLYRIARSVHSPKE